MALEPRRVTVRKAVKKFVNFRPRIRSRHPSHDILRTELPLLPFRSVVRLGSTTVVDVPNIVECNTVQAVKNSSSKLLMKQCFLTSEVKTADWFVYNRNNNFDQIGPFHTENDINISNLPYPIVAKHHFGSRGEGNFLLNNQQELEAWMRGKTVSNYIFEKFYNFNREYRLHVTKYGCFYSCRKMLKHDTPEANRWFRNDSNSVWIVEYKDVLLEDNPEFDKPTNWDTIVAESVKALNAVGLDVGAVDLRIQSSKTPKGKTRENPEFIIVEINSAPSFGEITAQRYIQEIPKILMTKYGEHT
jgi:hypothetical protein